MLSTFGGINTAASGIYTQQAALDTVGHNVSNASTDGYSRQTANIVSNTPQTVDGSSGNYQIGTGSDVATVTRARDQFLDQQYWKENSTLSNTQNVQTLLGKVETSLGEPGDTGLQSVLNSFWQSWQDLATDASDDGTRTTVSERGVELVNAIQSSSKQLTNMVSDINDTISLRVGTINQDASEISQLNRQISLSEADGSHANDLRDKRDSLIDNLSSYGDTSVMEDSQGRYIVQFGNTTLVSAVSCEQLKTVNSLDPDYGYEVTNVIVDNSSQNQVSFSNGELGSLINTRDSTSSNGIKGYLNNLSSMSQFLLQDFNAVHRSGYGTDNTTNNNFFGASNNNYSITGVSGLYQKRAWIDALEVSPAILTTGGIAKIAAKSAGDSIGVDQTNTLGGAATVFASGSYTGGSTPTNVTIKVDSVTGSGVVSQIEYSTDGGKTYSAPVTGSGSYTLTINGLSVTANFANSTDTKVNDQYSFTLTQNTADKAIAIKPGNSNDGAGTILSATGTYANGDTATNVTVKVHTTSTSSPYTITSLDYSTDGGTTWVKGVTPTSGVFSATVSGVTVKFQIANTTGTSPENDQYYFTLSKGNVASGDNAVLLGERLKSDTSQILGNQSLDGYYSSVVGALGVQSQNAARLQDNQQTLVSQITNSRQSVSGVDLNEEMTDMIRFQKGYASSAKILSTMNDMLDTLINSVR